MTTNIEPVHFAITESLQYALKVTGNEDYLKGPAYSGSAGLDLYCARVFEIEQGQTRLIDTGIRTMIPPDHVGILKERSSIGKRYDPELSLQLRAGVIDSDYRGVIYVKVSLPFGSYHHSALYKPGDRLPYQLVVHKCTNNYVAISEEIFEERADFLTERGSRGFGSSN